MNNLRNQYTSFFSHTVEGIIGDLQELKRLIYRYIRAKKY